MDGLEVLLFNEVFFGGGINDSDGLIFDEEERVEVVGCNYAHDNVLFYACDLEGVVDILCC